MDEYSGKKATDRLVVSRKGSGLVLRNTANNREPNALYCNRLGCSGRLNSIKSTQDGFSGKPKSLMPSVRTSSSGKEMVGSSSRTCSTIGNPKKSFTRPQRKLSSSSESDSSETSTIQDGLGKVQRRLRVNSRSPKSTDASCMDMGCSSVTSHGRYQGDLIQRSGMRNKDSPVGSSISTGCTSTSQASRVGTSRYGLRNVKCNSTSAVISSGCSQSDVYFNRRKDVEEKRVSVGENRSAARGKKTSGSSLEGRNSSSGYGISISESRGVRRISSHSENGSESVKTRRSINGHRRTRISSENNSLSLQESPFMISQMPQPEISIDGNIPSLTHPCSTELSFRRPVSHSRTGSSSCSSDVRAVRPASPEEVGMTRGSFRRYNVDGIAEVLLALERIEQDEELTYEQVILLETSLFLSGLNFHDQHREMRLDIDNMSYEELLALEERMGTVSTALTDEALSQCLKRSIYQSAPPNDDDDVNYCGAVKDDIKCCICQEEYETTDEVGRLQCEHQYHEVCIQQWLRLKNWCPICKASAAPAPPSPS